MAAPTDQFIALQAINAQRDYFGIRSDVFFQLGQLLSYYFQREKVLGKNHIEQTVSYEFLNCRLSLEKPMGSGDWPDFPSGSGYWPPPPPPFPTDGSGNIVYEGEFCKKRSVYLC